MSCLTSPVYATKLVALDQTSIRKTAPTMASVTIKGIPDEILERLRQRAAADHRSLNKEVIHLLGAALSSGFVPDGAAHRKEAADHQAEAWDRLAGRWDSDQRVEDEIADIFSARSEGRDIVL
jgi:plasmid stability protein